MALPDLDPMLWLRKLGEKSPESAMERARKAQEAIVGTLDSTAALGSGLLNQAIGGAVAAPWLLIPARRAPRRPPGCAP